MVKGPEPLLLAVSGRFEVAMDRRQFLAMTAAVLAIAALPKDESSHFADFEQPFNLMGDMDTFRLTFDDGSRLIVTPPKTCQVSGAIIHSGAGSMAERCELVMTVWR